MYHRVHLITPSQQATTGALDIFVEGFRAGNVRQQLIGLSVLSSATEAQIAVAMPSVQSTQRVTLAEIQSMLAS